MGTGSIKTGINLFITGYRSNPTLSYFLYRSKDKHNQWLIFSGMVVVSAIVMKMLF